MAVVRSQQGLTQALKLFAEMAARARFLPLNSWQDLAIGQEVQNLALTAR